MGALHMRIKIPILWYEAPGRVPAGVVILVWADLHSLSELILGGVIIENRSFVAPRYTVSTSLTFPPDKVKTARW